MACPCESPIKQNWLIFICNIVVRDCGERGAAARERFIAAFEALTADGGKARKAKRMAKGKSHTRRGGSSRTLPKLPHLHSSYTTVLVYTAAIHM